MTVHKLQCNFTLIYCSVINACKYHVNLWNAKHNCVNYALFMIFPMFVTILDVIAQICI